MPDGQCTWQFDDQNLNSTTVSCVNGLSTSEILTYVGPTYSWSCQCPVNMENYCSFQSERDCMLSNECEFLGRGRNLSVLFNYCQAQGGYFYNVTTTNHTCITFVGWLYIGRTTYTCRPTTFQTSTVAQHSPSATTPIIAGIYTICAVAYRKKLFYSEVMPYKKLRRLLFAHIIELTSVLRANGELHEISCQVL